MSFPVAARRAEALASRLPPLLVAAERVAATVAQGVHGRRRTGEGDTFWQYRPFVPGDPASRIDWRQTAKGQRVYLRETEWEAADTVFLWQDSSAAMHWRSRADFPEKAERASLLLLALASLLLRGGEKIRLLNNDTRGFQGPRAMDALAETLLGHRTESALPAPQDVPRHARLVLFGDFLSPLPDVQASMARFAAQGLQGRMLQILDPAEADLPFTGRVRFSGLRGEKDMLIPRADALRADYAQALARQQAGLAAIGNATGFSFASHLTDQSPEAALLALYTALAHR